MSPFFPFRGIHAQCKQSGCRCKNVMEMLTETAKDSHVSQGKSWGKVQDQKTRKMGDRVWGYRGNRKKRVQGLKRRGDEEQLGGFLPRGRGEGE